MDTLTDHPQPSLYANELTHDMRNVLCVISGRIRILEKILHSHSSLGLGEGAVHHQLDCLRQAVLQGSMLCDSAYHDTLLGSDCISDVAEAVYVCCDMASPLLPESVEFSINIDANIPNVYCAALQLNRMLLNVMKNGMESMREHGGILSIGLTQVELKQHDVESFLSSEPRPAGQYICIKVDDQGCGMDAEGFMNDPVSLHSEKGFNHGYGLKSVLSIVNASQGLMHISSQPEQGTSVSVFIPCMSVAVNQTLKHEESASFQVQQLMTNISQRMQSGTARTVHSET